MLEADVLLMEGPMPTWARQNMAVFTEIYGKFGTSQRADVGIGPSWEAACFMRYRATKPTFL